MAKPVSLVCYTVSDSESSEEEMDGDDSAATAVNYVLERILREVTHGLRDFGDLYIKQEPLDCEEWEAVGQDYRDSRDGTAVKIEDDDDDSSSSSSSEDESLPDVAVVKAEVEMEAESEGMVLCETYILTFEYR
jgi:hypothetical protein